MERAEGGLPAGAKVSASAIVDGKSAYTGQTTIDSAGNCSVEFALRAQIERGDGTLSLAVADGGVIEPIAKTIPILLNSVDLSIYPEGGDLVAGLSCRVYMEARTPAQKPADLVGEVIDSRGNAVANVTTEHEGRGRFVLTPEEGQTYAIKLSQPSGITRHVSAAECQGERPCAAVDDGRDRRGRGRQVGHCCNSGWVVFRYLVQTPDRGGFHGNQDHSRPDSGSCSYAAGLGRRCAGGDGERCPGHSGCRAADFPQQRQVAARQSYDRSIRIHTGGCGDGHPLYDGRCGQAGRGRRGCDGHGPGRARTPEKRDCAPRLGAMVLLEDDVRELADAEIYLDPNDPKANIATDLLLGTQGWRRFATVDSPKFLETYGDAARRVLGDVQPVNLTRSGFGVAGGGGMEENGLGRMAPAGAVFRLAAPQVAPIGQIVAQPPVNLPKDAQIQLEDKLLPFADRAKSMPMMPPPAEVIRIYAHDLRPNRASDDRVDFAETLYWAAGVKTDERTGTATVTFHLNDSVTSFDVTADAFDASGELGEGKATITASEPFYVEPKLPLEVSSGDVIHLPIAAVNGTQDTLDNVTFTLTGGQGMSISPVEAFSLPAGQRVRRLVDVHIGAVPGTWDFLLQAQAGSFSDRVTRPLVVKPLGFPTEIAKGGLLNAGSRVVHVIRVPDSLVSGGVKTSAALYPTPLANLTEALARLQDLWVLRADQFDDLSAGHGGSIFHHPQRHRPHADFPQQRAAGQGLRPLEGFRVPEQRVRMVWRRSGTRMPDGLRPVGIHRHVRGSQRGSRDAAKHTGNGCWPSETARAAWPICIAPCTPGSPLDGAGGTIEHSQRVAVGEVLEGLQRGRVVLAQRVTQGVGVPGTRPDQALMRPGEHLDRLRVGAVAGD